MGVAGLFHYRTKDKVDVDVILGNSRRQVVAIEVKAAPPPRGGGFRGPRHLAGPGWPTI